MFKKLHLNIAVLVLDAGVHGVIVARVAGEVGLHKPVVRLTNKPTLIDLFLNKNEPNCP